MSRTRSKSRKESVTTNSKSEDKKGGFEDERDISLWIMVPVIVLLSIIAGTMVYMTYIDTTHVKIYSTTVETCINIDCVDTGYEAGLDISKNKCVPIMSLLKLRYTPVKSVVLTTSTGDTLTLNKITTNRESMLVEVVFYNTHKNQEYTCTLQIQFVDGNFVEVGVGGEYD